MSVRDQPERPALRLALIVPSVVVDPHVRELADWVTRQPFLVLAGVFHLEDRREPTPARGTLYVRSPRETRCGAAQRAAIAVSERLERTMLARDRVHRTHLRDCSLTPDVVERCTPLRSMTRGQDRVCVWEQDVEMVRGLHLDLMVVCGIRGLAGGMLDAARFGILAVEPDGDSATGGAPVGFREVFERRDRSGFSIVKVTHEPDPPHVLKRGFFPTRPYGMLNAAFLCRIAGACLMSEIARIAATRALPAPKPHMQAPERSRPGFPTVAQSGVYVARLLARRASDRFERASRSEPSWNVSFTRDDWRRGADPARSVDIPNPQGHFLADPFLVERSGRTYCFVEDYPYAAGKAHLSVFELVGDRAVDLGTCLDEPFHLSFPFVFEYRSELYMCPECSGSGQVRVYRCVEFPMKWELEAVLMENVSAADTMLFERDGKWWMLSNRDSGSVGDHCSELHVFWADSPLSGRWHAHPQNPVIVDSSRARNGGLVTDGGRLFRCGQVQGFGVYGKALKIFEIEHISEGEYREQWVQTVDPLFSNGQSGIHHLSTTGKITAFDRRRKRSDVSFG